MTRQYGHLTVETHTELQRQIRRKLCVWLDGVEVTHRCVEADDITGRVVLFCNDPEHRNWQRREIGTHNMPDADDRLCVLHVLGDVDIKP